MNNGGLALADLGGQCNRSAFLAVTTNARLPGQSQGVWFFFPTIFGTLSKAAPHQSLDFNLIRCQLKSDHIR